MNIEALNEEHVEWADYVFISAMAIQRKSVIEIIALCKAMGTKIVAGGPLFTACHQDFQEIDHFVLNEAEVTLPAFLNDLQGGSPKRVYTSSKFPELSESPTPMWSLIKKKKYFSMTIQFSRGCPYNCEFCDITTLFGRKSRTKHKGQILAELESLYSEGWRGSVFFVDDNFIGHKAKLKKDILPSLIAWMEQKKHPFIFSTETSIDISDDEELMRMLVRAGFDGVFVGIESPSKESLAECSKTQNMNRDLVASVKKIQSFGLQVRGGFIVGFDNDSKNIFQRQIDFIQNSGIITAMVGMLNAPPGSRLYRRIAQEGRLLGQVSGDNTDCTTNFIPKMGYETLINGYTAIIQGIYSAKPYYERVRLFLKEYKPQEKRPARFKIRYLFHNSGHLRALFRSFFVLGIRDKERIKYWKLLFWTLFKKPAVLSQAITFAIYGFHFRKVFEQYL
jgi:radical SAM superfamily enzyme YgiQ (UPF0313 family)